MTLYLPRATQPVATTVTQIRRHTETSLKGTLLLVEDDDDVAMATEELIRDIGFDVTRAVTPSEALDFLRAPGAHYDIIFSDIVMPGTMSGLDFARVVQGEYPALPIILTTGHSQAASRGGAGVFHPAQTL